LPTSALKSLTLDAIKEYFAQDMVCFRRFYSWDEIDKPKWHSENHTAIKRSNDHVSPRVLLPRDRASSYLEERNVELPPNLSFLQPRGNREHESTMPADRRLPLSSSIESSLISDHVRRWPLLREQHQVAPEASVPRRHTYLWTREERKIINQATRSERNKAHFTEEQDRETGS
jgi:hypothetical protein